MPEATGGRGLQFRPQHADDVIGGDHAHQPVLRIHDWHGDQVVLVEQFRHRVITDALIDSNQRFLRQRQ